MTTAARTARWVLLWLLVALPTVPQAETDCHLGVYDDMERHAQFGTMTGSAKDLYVGISFADSEQSMSRVEFSLHGLEGFFTLTPMVFDSPALIAGSVTAPADSSGTGGVVIEWSSCLQGSRTIMKVPILYVGTPPVDRIIRVLRRFPPTQLASPIFNRCDGTPVAVVGDCYILNGSGAPVDCDIVAIEQTTWSLIKSLYE